MTRKLLVTNDAGVADFRGMRQEYAQKSGESIGTESGGRAAIKLAEVLTVPDDGDNHDEFAARIVKRVDGAFEQVRDIENVRMAGGRLALMRAGGSLIAVSTSIHLDIQYTSALAVATDPLTGETTATAAVLYRNSSGDLARLQYDSADVVINVINRDVTYATAINDIGRVVLINDEWRPESGGGGGGGSAIPATCCGSLTAGSFLHPELPAGKQEAAFTFQVQKDPGPDLADVGVRLSDGSTAEINPTGNVDLSYNATSQMWEADFSSDVTIYDSSGTDITSDPGVSPTADFYLDFSTSPAELRLVMGDGSDTVTVKWLIIGSAQGRGTMTAKRDTLPDGGFNTNCDICIVPILDTDSCSETLFGTGKGWPTLTIGDMSGFNFSGTGDFVDHIDGTTVGGNAVLDWTSEMDPVTGNEPDLVFNSISCDPAQDEPTGVIITTVGSCGINVISDTSAQVNMTRTGAWAGTALVATITAKVQVTLTATGSNYTEVFVKLTRAITWAEETSPGTYTQRSWLTATLTGTNSSLSFKDGHTESVTLTPDWVMHDLGNTASESRTLSDIANTIGSIDVIIGKAPEEE